MKLINIIILNCGIVQKVISFHIPTGTNPNVEQSIVNDAEERFKTIALEYGAELEDIESYIEDGNYSDMSGNDIYFYWSDEIV